MVTSIDITFDYEKYKLDLEHNLLVEKETCTRLNRYVNEVHRYYDQKSCVNPIHLEKLSNPSNQS